MGGTCCNGNNDRQNRDIDLKKFGGQQPKLLKLPLDTIIHMQAIIRGFIARTRIRNKYGFVATNCVAKRTL